MAGRAEQALERMIALTEGSPRARARERRSVRGIAVAAAALVTVVLVAAVAVIAFGAAVDNRWYRIVAMEGVSMEPTIRAGDALLITAPPSSLRPGQVVLLDIDGRLVIHRVVASHSDGSLTTKGDANRDVDRWDRADASVAVKGVYRGRIPVLGRLLRLVQGDVAP